MCFSVKLYKKNAKTKVILLAFLLSLQVSFAQLPVSDSQNMGNWVLNTEISDEFNDGILDRNKWQVQGEDGIYKSNFIGRAPSQFNPNNAVVESNKLVIKTKWEPDFPFSTTPQNGVEYENITTAAVISKEQFHYGYMEIRCKAAKAAITSSFWTTGFQSELDMFEMFGDPQPGEANLNWKKRLKFNMISWNPNHIYSQQSGNGPAHTRNIQASNNTADAFHVYGFDWTSEYVKVYIDGVLHPNGTILRSELGEDRWVTNVPYWIWFDSETFPWLGIPEEADLPVQYEIDYIRIWEKKNLLDTSFFGFENTINIDGTEQDWFIANVSTDYLEITNEKSYRWAKSLKFSHNGTLSDNAVIFSPYRSISLNSDNYTLSFKIWLEPNASTNNVQLVLDDPNVILDFDISTIETGKWVTLSQDFTTNANSGNSARLRVRIRPTDAGSGSSTLYIDDIFINTNSTLSINEEVFLNTSKMYPNPVNSITQDLYVSSKNTSKVEIYSFLGAKLVSLEKTGNPFKIPIHNLQSGLYFVVLMADEKTEMKKLIIH